MFLFFFHLSTKNSCGSIQLKRVNDQLRPGPVFFLVFTTEVKLKRPSHDKQLANMLANCWRQIELVSILANFFTNVFVLVNSYLTCERLTNVSCQLSTCLPTVVVSFISHTPTLVCRVKAALGTDHYFYGVGGGGGGVRNFPLRTSFLN